MKCPINNIRTDECDQDFTPEGFRTHYIMNHDTLSLQVTILFMLSELLEDNKK
jgi:hypothetical protein